MSLKRITKENTPPSAVPYRNVNNPFRFQFFIPGSGIVIEEDKNGICYISADMFGELVAGDNITIDRLEDGRIMISSVSTVSDIAAGQNVTIDIDPDTGTAIINAITGGDNEHYQGIFDTAQDLIDFDTDPETGDYGMIKNVTYSDGVDTTWNGQYKYCFYINGKWTVVDQMLTFTKDLDLLQQFYSVGGSSPVIYLHEVARSGNFNDLNNVPIVATPEVTVEGSTVTATCATEGAEIWYTTDGTMPHVNGTKYTGPITLSGATTFRFVGIKNGMINSLEAVVSADYGLEPPTIDLDWHDGTITMDNPNQSGTIYYTTDGSTPTNASTAYMAPFVITEATTFKAVVIDDSESSDVYSIRYNKLFLDNRSVGGNGIIGTAIYGISSYYYEGAVRQKYGEVHYTIDGSTPTFASEVMVAPISRPYYAGAIDVKTKAFGEGFVPSNVDSYTAFSDKPVSPPIIFDPETGNVSLCNSYFESNNLNYGRITGLYGAVKLFSDGLNRYCQVFYTTDGSTPTAQSTLYTGPFQIEENTTVRAIVVAYGQYYSDVSTENIVIVDEPVVSMNYLNGEITMAAPAGMDIYYTLNGSTPSILSTRYTGPIKDVPQLLSRTVKAVAVRGLNEYSAIVTANYTRVIGELPNHRVTYNNSAGLISVEAPGIPNGSEMYYAVDDPGADIVAATYSRYTSPVSLDFYSADNPQIVIFKAALQGYLPYYQYSDALGYDEADAPAITVDEDTDLVTISLDGNTADIPLQTNDNTPTLGARIYYTTDGSTPTDQSTLYTRPFTLPEGSTAIKAITVCYGEWESDVTTEEVGPAPAVDYMYFEAVQEDSVVSLISMMETAPDLEYSTDGETWQEWQHTTEATPGEEEGDPDTFIHIFDTLTLTDVGDRVYLRGDNPNGFLDMENSALSVFSLTGKIAAHGNAQSLVDGDTPTLVAKTMPRFSDALLSEQFSDVLVSAPSLPATTLAEYCYYGMFNGCTGLTQAPSLPATTLAEDCYYGMFNGCTFNMSDDGTTFNFAFPTPPVTAGANTYYTYYDIAQWMRNTNGFN